jgi:hypothetical protein
MPLRSKNGAILREWCEAGPLSLGVFLLQRASPVLDGLIHRWIWLELLGGFLRNQPPQLYHPRISRCGKGPRHVKPSPDREARSTARHVARRHRACVAVLVSNVLGPQVLKIAGSSMSTHPVHSAGHRVEERHRDSPCSTELGSANNGSGGYKWASVSGRAVGRCGRQEHGLLSHGDQVGDFSGGLVSTCLFDAGHVGSWVNRRERSALAQPRISCLS